MAKNKGPRRPRSSHSSPSPPSSASSNDSFYNPWLATAVVVAGMIIAFQRLAVPGELPGDPSGDLSGDPSGNVVVEWSTGFYSDGAARGEIGSPPRAKLYENGGDGDGIDVVIDSEESFRSLGTVYNDLGQIVRSASHVGDGSTLFRAPTHPGTHFQWPGVRVGHRRKVSGVASPTGKPMELETLSMGRAGEPRVFYVHNFMSDAEAEHLIAFATDDSNPYKMTKSTAGSHKSWAEDGGRASVSTLRTSENAFDMQTPTSFEIKRRGFRLLRFGEYMEEMADGIQILRYELGQAYVSHHDYFPKHQSEDHGWDPKRGGSNRFATIFLYLSDVEFGGHTVFPKLPRLTNSSNPELVGRLGSAPSDEVKRKLIAGANLRKNSWEVDLIDKCSTQFAVPPRRGDAILFYSQRPDGMLDPASLHGACPVLAGTKWAANLWVWNACRFSQCRRNPLNPAAELPPKLRAPIAMP